MPTAVNYAALEEELKTGKGFIPILYEDAQNIKRTAKYAKNRELLITHLVQLHIKLLLK